MQDFSWLARGVNPVELPDPAQQYQKMMTLSELARRDREGTIRERQLSELDAAQKDEREIYGRAEVVGFEQAIKEAAMAGKTQGAQLALDAWKKRQSIELENKLKTAQADQASANAAQHRATTDRTILDPSRDRAMFLARNPNLTVEQVQGLVRDMPPEKMPTDVDFGNLDAGRQWIQQFAMGGVPAKDQMTNATTAAHNADQKQNWQDVNAQTKVRDAAHAGYQNRMATVAEGRESRIGDPTAGVPTMSADAKAIAAEYERSGQRLPGSWTRAGIGRSTEILEEVARQVRAAGGLPGDGSVVSGRVQLKASQGALNANVKDVTAIRPYVEMFHKNAEVLDQLAEGVAKTNVPLLNKPINYVVKELAGDPKMAEYLAQVRIVQTEAARVLNNPKLTGVLTDSARHEVEDILNGTMTIEQSRAVVKRLLADSNNRMSALEDEGRRRTQEITGIAGGPSGARPTTTSPTTENNRPTANQGGKKKYTLDVPGKGLVEFPDEASMNAAKFALKL